MPKGKHILTGELSFVDNKGNPVAPPDVTAVALQGPKAIQICGILLWGYSTAQANKNLETYGTALPGFLTCVATVAQVLARAEQIKKAKGASIRARAAALGCTVFVHEARVVRPTIHLTCTSTSTGMTIGLSPLSSRQTLRQAFAGHPPKLIIGRSNATSTPARVNFGVLWRAH